MTEPLLEVRDLEKHYPLTEGILKRQVGAVRAVDGVSFTLDPGETLGLVGESGCGKSTVATSMLRLEEPTGGRVVFDGENIVAFDDEELKRFRREAQIVFQDPTSSFDPRMSVGESVTEALRVHGLSDRARRRAVGEDLLERVGLSATDYDRYPHEFSGGQKQRVAIARALVVNPRLIVADEPVSALDVSVKSAVLDLLADLQQEFGIALVFISHDLSVVREVADRVAVMYLGEIVETAPTERLFESPEHPYTEALLSAIPEPNPDAPGRTIRLSGSQATWRRVLDARQRVHEDDVDVAAVRELWAPAGADGTGLSETEVVTALRAEFDLPDELGAPAVERAVGEALAALAADDHSAAAAAFDTTVTTPCEEHIPTRQPVQGSRDHEVACLLRHPPEGVRVPNDEARADDD